MSKTCLTVCDFKNSEIHENIDIKTPRLKLEVAFHGSPFTNHSLPVAPDNIFFLRYRRRGDFMLLLLSPMLKDCTCVDFSRLEGRQRTGKLVEVDEYH